MLPTAEWRRAMARQDLKARLRAGEALHGVLNPYADANQAELLAMSGWDFLLFDAEHGVLQPADLAHLARACEQRGCTPLVRTPGREPHMIARFLDAGARGVMAPLVNDAAAVDELVAALKYPPLGARGLAPMRALDFGLADALPQQIARANAETLAIVQIETARALDRLDEIVNHPAVDVVFIGPADLSTSLGHCMDMGHPAVRDAIVTIAQATTAAGKHLGMLVAQPEHFAMARALGAQFNASYMDSLLLAGCRAFQKAARAESPAALV